MIASVKLTSSASRQKWLSSPIDTLTVVNRRPDSRITGRGEPGSCEEGSDQVCWYLQTACLHYEARRIPALSRTGSNRRNRVRSPMVLISLGVLRLLAFRVKQWQDTRRSSVGVLPSTLSRLNHRTGAAMRLVRQDSPETSDEPGVTQ